MKTIFKLKKIIFISLVLILITNFYKVNAQQNTRTFSCIYQDVTDYGYADQSNTPNTTNLSTAVNLNAVPNMLSYVFSNTSVDNMTKCFASEGLGGISYDSTCQISEAEVELNCKSFGLASGEVHETITGNQTSSNIDTFSSIPRSGGLLGVAYKFENVTKQPVPLNMAFYLKNNFQKIPILKNTAFAQDDRDYRGPLIEIIFKYWEISRNFAYAFMSIVMMIIGILIITQNKVDAKTAVTVQQALPQVIIALFLITFSYPIGATGASLSYGLLNSASGWAKDLLKLKQIETPEYAGMGALATLGFLGSGAIALITAMLNGLIVLLFSILVLFKILSIYLKMILSIVAAPLIFAIGSIPGQNNNTTKWFKQFGANIITLPLMVIGFWLVREIVFEIFLGHFEINQETFLSNYGGFLLGPLVIFVGPIMAYAGMQAVMNIPTKINEIFGIESSKKR